jgi:hypothetical protein
LRKQWVEKLICDFKSEGVGFKALPPKREIYIEWIFNAWKNISTNVIISGFRGAGLLCDDGVSKESICISEVGQPAGIDENLMLLANLGCLKNLMLKMLHLINKSLVSIIITDNFL